MGDCGLVFFYAETPIHPGGSDSIGVLDRPIQRESTTGLPTVWGQSAKGALRDHAEEDPLRWPDVEAVFGSPPPSPDGGDTGGAPDPSRPVPGPPRPGWLAVGDIRLVAFPVPTLRRTFAWVTSPLLLARQARVAHLVGAETPPVPHVDDGGVVPAAADWIGADDEVVVGEYRLRAGSDVTPVSAWATWLAQTVLPDAESDDDGDPFGFFRQKLRRDLLLVSDDQMVALTEEHAEVVVGVQLERDAKIVKEGPWYTEYLPAETILCSLLRCCSDDGDLDTLPGRLDGEVLVAGGDESIGKGLLWLRWYGAKDR